MADEGVFCNQLSMLRKAGANVSATVNAATDVTFVYSNDFIGQAEAKINVETGYNWSDAYAGLNVDVKDILSEAASNLSAMYCINYDMSGYSSRAEAETMLDVLYNGYRDCIKILRDKAQAEFMQNA